MPHVLAKNFHPDLLENWIVMPAPFLPYDDGDGEPAWTLKNEKNYGPSSRRSVPFIAVPSELGPFTILRDQISHRLGIVTPHLIWWQLILIGGFAVVAIALGVGAIGTFISLRRDRKTQKQQKLEIYSAVYGTGPENDKDVTDILQQHNRDALAVDVSNNSLGCDPAPNRHKRLEVEYSYGNRSRRIISRSENSRLVIPEDQEIQRLATEVQRLRQMTANLEQETRNWKDKYTAENTEKTNFQKEFARAKNTATELELKLSGLTKPGSSGETVIDTIDRITATLPLTKPRLEILTPLMHGEVGLYRIVRGFVSPPNNEVQVLVFAGDDWWYLQGDAQVDGSSWNKECKFGLDKPNYGGDYKLVALLGKHVTESRVRELPKDVPKSNEIKVRRTHDAGRTLV